MGRGNAETLGSILKTFVARMSEAFVQVKRNVTIFIYFFLRLLPVISAPPSGQNVV